MKKFIPIFYLMFTLLNHTYADNTASQTGLLWQINKPGLSPSYLFATIHSDDPRVTQLPPLVQNRLEHADTVGLELLMDVPTIRKSANAKFISEGLTLDQVLESPLYRRVVEALRPYNLPESLVQRMKPWAVFSTLNLPLPKTGEYLDLRLYRQVLELEIPPYGLETVEEQIRILDSLSFAAQVRLLTDLVAHLDELPQMFANLQELYLRRDLTALMAACEKYLEEWSQHPELTQMFFKRILADRHPNMLERMLPNLQRGNTFIAVGALHLPGDTGLLKLLEARGYEVVAVY